MSPTSSLSLFVLSVLGCFLIKAYKRPRFDEADNATLGEGDDDGDVQREQTEMSVPLKRNRCQRGIKCPVACSQIEIQEVLVKSNFGCGHG